MSGYMDFAYSKNYKLPEDSMLTGKSQDAYDPSSYQSSQDVSGGADASASAASTGGAAAGGMAMGGPAGAAVTVGGQFLSQYLAQKAANERAKREQQSRAIQQYADNQDRGFDTLMQTYKGALR